MRMTTTRLLATLVALLAFAAACGDSDDTTTGDDATTTTVSGSGTTVAGTEDDGASDEGAVPDGPTITIGAQNFGESAILAEVYGQALAAAGYPVEQQNLGGFRDLVYASFDSGQINFTLEYVSSTLEFLNGFAGEASDDVDASVAALQDQLSERGLQAMAPAPGENSNVFVVSRATADERDLSSLGDLTDDLRLGGPADCEENAACIPGLRDIYDVDLSGRFTPLDGGGPLTVAALTGGEIDVAILFSTDPLITENDWVVLDDDQGLVNAENIVPVASDEVVDAYGDDLVSLVDEVSAAVTTAALTAMNRRYNIDRDDADDIAREWLTEQGLLS
jgi:osmoprotectant transport system substrate-binding protein